MSYSRDEIDALLREERIARMEQALTLYKQLAETQDQLMRATELQQQGAELMKEIGRRLVALETRTQ